MYQKRSAGSRLAEAIEGLRAQDYPCLIYENPSEKSAVVASFFMTGLRRGEKCIYIAGDESSETVLEILSAGGIDTDAAVAGGALLTVFAGNLYPEETEPDHDCLFELIKREVNIAQNAGFTAIRVASELAGDFRSAFHADRVIECKVRLSRLMPDINLLAICLYGRHRFAPETLLRIIRAHPKIIFNGVMCRNNSHLSLDEFFSPDLLRFVLDHQLNGAMDNENLVNDLREKELLLQAVVENTSDLVFVKDLDGRYVMMNRAGVSFVGRSMGEILGRTDDELFSQDSARKSAEYDRLAIAGNEPVTYEEVLTSGGLTRTYLSTKGACRDASGKVVGLFGIARDITQRKYIEKSLRESEELFHTLCDSSPIGIFKLDSIGNNLYSNPRWEEISGLSSAESVGLGWTIAVHPEDRNAFLTDQKNTGWGGPYSKEYRLLTPEGKTVWVRVLESPLKNQDGGVTGYVGTVEDITELQQAKREMLKAQKLESLGVLAGGIAHDFNNILSAILGNISLAQLQLHDVAQIEKRLMEVETAALRAKELTQQLLTFARGGEPVKSIIVLDSLLKEAAGIAVQDSVARCEFNFSDDLWPVEADRGQINRVIHNLVINAVQAMPQGGTITLEAKNVRMTEMNKFVEISVSDTGTGIPEQFLEKIFDPYFTTKQQQSGLGLSTCYSIISKHGGHITVSSDFGNGSTFCVYLPAAQRSGESGTGPFSFFPSGQGRILVMDDEKQVREIMKEMLEMLGYRVECAKEGSEAVELYRKGMEEGVPYAAVILDLTVPGGVGGIETIASLQDMDPNVKAIVSSGYSSDPVMAKYGEYGFQSVLAKPYRLQDVNDVLRKLV